jgi:hypothetical protein
MKRIGTAVATALLTWALVLPAGAANAAVVSTNPPATPQIGGSARSGSDGTIEVVRQITQCGDMMIAVGSFTQVRNPNSTTPIARNNVFGFRATAPYTVLPWNPNANGEVDTAACAPDGEIILGGQFTTIGGAAVRNLAKVNATTGANNAAFTLHPAGRVNHVEVVTDAAAVQHLLVGGNAAPWLRSVNPITGVADRYGVPAISGIYTFPGSRSNTTKIYNMTVSPDGSAVLMTGVFTSVGGQARQQLFRLNLTAGNTTLSPWFPLDMNTHCSTVQPFYAQDAAWSPDGTRIYIATTGFKPYDQPRGNTPRIGPCDAVIGYPATERALRAGLPNGGERLWINYTGCDSLYSVAADDDTVYIGGHQRWINNGRNCDRLGAPPARAQSGLGEVSPTTGLAVPGPNRGRGLGAADLLRTADGLWVASDNQANTDMCAGRHNRMGICFLPNA